MFCRLQCIGLDKIDLMDLIVGASTNIEPTHSPTSKRNISGVRRPRDGCSSTPPRRGSKRRGASDSRDFLGDSSLNPFHVRKAQRFSSAFLPQGARRARAQSAVTGKRRGSEGGSGSGPHVVGWSISFASWRGSSFLTSVLMKLESSACFFRCGNKIL